MVVAAAPTLEKEHPPPASTTMNDIPCTDGILDFLATIDILDIIAIWHDAGVLTEALQLFKFRHRNLT